jgi:peptidoglycan hydrolase CwlO-like protein
MEDTSNSLTKEEGVETPRQKVEAAFAKREELNTKLNQLNTRFANREVTPDALAEQETLLAQERDAWEVSFDELVSHEPEAQAWLQIATEKRNETRRTYGPQSVHGATPTDRSWASALMTGAEYEWMDASKHLAALQGAPQTPAAGAVLLK